MIKLLDYLTGIIIAAFGTLLLIGCVYYQFTNPEKTQTELFLDMWTQWLCGVLLLYVSIVNFKLLKNWDSFNK